MQKAIGRFGWAIGITTVILVGELLGGYFSHSLSLLSDAAHVFFDLSALLISFTALLLSKRYKKLESRAALVNSILLMIVAISIGYEAWQRLHHPQNIQSGIMLVVAVIGFLGNALVAWKLHDFAKKNINIKAAFYHVLGDLLASVGVILAALIIAFTGWQQVDTLISFAIAAIIFGGALNLFVGNVKANKSLLKGFLLTVLACTLFTADIKADVTRSKIHLPFGTLSKPKILKNFSKKPIHFDDYGTYPSEKNIQGFFIGELIQIEKKTPPDNLPPIRILKLGSGGGSDFSTSYILLNHSDKDAYNILYYEMVSVAWDANMIISPDEKLILFYTAGRPRLGQKDRLSPEILIYEIKRIVSTDDEYWDLFLNKKLSENFSLALDKALEGKGKFKNYESLAYIEKLWLSPDQKILNFKCGFHNPVVDNLTEEYLKFLRETKVEGSYLLDLE